MPAGLAFAIADRRLLGLLALTAAALQTHLLGPGLPMAAVHAGPWIGALLASALVVARASAAIPSMQPSCIASLISVAISRP